MKQKQSIATYLLLRSGLFVLVVTVVLGSWIAQVTSSSLRQVIGSDYVKWLEQTLDVMDRNLHERLADVQAFAQADIFEDLLLQQESSEAAQLRLNSFKRAYGQWDALHVIDTQGRVLVSSEDEAIGKYIDALSTDTEVMSGLAEKNTYVSEVVTDTTLKRKTILFGAPIVRAGEDGVEVLGYVVGHFA